MARGLTIGAGALAGMLAACATAPEEAPAVAVVPEWTVAATEPPVEPAVTAVAAEDGPIPLPVRKPPVPAKVVKQQPRPPAVYVPQPARDSGSSTAGMQWVNGYCRKDGRCVSGHWRKARSR